MHDSLTPFLHRSDRPLPVVRDNALTVIDLQRLAAEALRVASRLVERGHTLDVTDPRTDSGGKAMTYRLKSVGDALVIQRRSDAESNPFCGLLVTPSSSGHAPRMLFDMGSLTGGTAQFTEAALMLEAVVHRASLS